MTNAFVEYYEKQAGSGIAGYKGIKYQRGHGLFGTILNYLPRIAKYLGMQALNTGVSIGNDYLQGGDFKESARKRLKTTGKTIVNDAIERAKRFTQSGSGKKRRRKITKLKKKPIKKKSKKISSKKKTKNKTKKKKTGKKKSVSRKSSTSKHLKDLFSSCQN